jgi:TonB family protein
MTAALNYIIEANAGLIMILAIYLLFLRRETNFKLMRFFLLAGIFSSLILPLIHIETARASSPLSISEFIPSYWLPEIVIGSEGTNQVEQGTLNFWKYTTVVYTTGLVLCLVIVFFQLIHLLRLIRNAKTYRIQKLRVAESPEDKPTFSFFHFIFIGKAHQLSTAEKQQIIRHESVHASQFHSFDVLLINALKIFFWFNPFIGTYKKIFIQLHEFEADARAVENSDMDKYCSLLAKVALQSADFTLANHFNNSLTVKRIEMMRTIKTNIKRWKLAVVALMLPALFFFISCQDQVGDDIMEITKNSSHALIVPEDIQKIFDKMKAENPDKKYSLLEMNETASARLEELQTQHGLPSSIQVFRTVDGKNVEDVIKGEAPGGVIVQRKVDNPDLKGRDGKTIIRQTKPKLPGEQTFAIVEFNDQASKIADASQTEDKVYTVVEHQPEFTGGYEAMMDFIKANLRYPADDRMKRIEGTVYTSFIVETDGSVSSVKTIRGISAASDAEARRVVSMFPKWTPARQSGKIVRVRFVMPIKFKLQNDSKPPATNIQTSPEQN